MSAPKLKAEGSSREAPIFSRVLSKRLVPKKMYLGSTAAKKAMGRTIAAIFAFEKKVVRQRAKEMQPIAKMVTYTSMTQKGV